MKKFTLCLKTTSIVGFSMFLCAFSDPEPISQYVDFLQKSFTDHYDFNQESGQIKRYELNITNNGFCRYKRYFNNGKTEYFSFRLAKFKDMDYQGSSNAGKLYLYTKGEDVIVQTYKDRGGDVDSMATQVVIPLKNIEPEDLNSIKENFGKIAGSATVEKPKD